MSRWYDLGTFGARLDRLVDSRGVSCLRCTFLNDLRYESDGRAIIDGGWVEGSNDNSVENFSSFRSIREIGSVIARLFGVDEDKMRSLLVDEEALRQGEIMEGVDVPVDASIGEVTSAGRWIVKKALNRSLEAIRNGGWGLDKPTPLAGRVCQVGGELAEMLGDRKSVLIAQLISVRHDTAVFDDFVTPALRDKSTVAIEKLRKFLHSVSGPKKFMERLERTSGFNMDTSYADKRLIEMTLLGEWLKSERVSGVTLLTLDSVPDNAYAGIEDHHVFGYPVRVDVEYADYARDLERRLAVAMEFIGQTLEIDPRRLFDKVVHFEFVGRKSERAGMSVSNTNILRVSPDKLSETLGKISARIYKNSVQGNAVPLGDVFKRTGFETWYYRQRPDLTDFVPDFVNAKAENGEQTNTVNFEAEMFGAYFASSMRYMCLLENGTLDRLGGVALSGAHVDGAPMVPELLRQFVDMTKECAQQTAMFSTIPDKIRNPIEELIENRMHL